MTPAGLIAEARDEARACARRPRPAPCQAAGSCDPGLRHAEAHLAAAIRTDRVRIALAAFDAGEDRGIWAAGACDPGADGAGTVGCDHPEPPTAAETSERLAKDGAAALPGQADRAPAAPAARA